MIYKGEMSLLNEIINSAVSEDSNLGEILRKCKVLASKLNNPTLAEWLIHEANGYPKESDIPGYRKLTLTVKGNFDNCAYSVSNVTVPNMCIPKEARETFKYSEFRESVHSAQELIRGANETGIYKTSVGDLAVFLHNKVYDGYGCRGAWGEIGKSGLVEIVNTVRNKILDFALDLQKNIPEAEDITLIKPQEVDQNLMTQIVNNNIFGNENNLIGIADKSKINIRIAKNDINELEKYLKSYNVQQEDINTLKSAITEDGEIEISNDKYGKSVSKWLGNMLQKAIEGTWSIGIATAGNVLGYALNQYYQ